MSSICHQICPLFRPRLLPSWSRWTNHVRWFTSSSTSDNTLPSPWWTFYLFIYTHFPLHDGPFIYLFIHFPLLDGPFIYLYTLPSPWRTFYLFIYIHFPLRDGPFIYLYTSLSMTDLLFIYLSNLSAKRVSDLRCYATRMKSSHFSAMESSHGFYLFCKSHTSVTLWYSSMANLKFPFSWLRPSPAACWVFILIIHGIKCEDGVGESESGVRDGGRFPVQGWHRRYILPYMLLLLLII